MVRSVCPCICMALIFTSGACLLGSTDGPHLFPDPLSRHDVALSQPAAAVEDNTAEAVPYTTACPRPPTVSCAARTPTPMRCSAEESVCAYTSSMPRPRGRALQGARLPDDLLALIHRRVRALHGPRLWREHRQVYRMPRAGARQTGLFIVDNLCIPVNADPYISCWSILGSREFEMIVSDQMVDQFNRFPPMPGAVYVVELRWVCGALGDMRSGRVLKLKAFLGHLDRSTANQLVRG